MLNNILLKPVISEKSFSLAKDSKFTFYVNKFATKKTIANAVQELFDVDVINVKTLKISGKTKKTGKKRLTTTTPNKKKAIIALKKGQTIEYFQLPEDKDKAKSKKDKKKTITASKDQQPKKRGLFSRIRAQRTQGK